MSSDPIRAALERLIKLNDAYENDRTWEPWTNAIEAARAALAAAPEGEPSDEELRDLWSWSSGQDQGPWPTQYHCFARAVLSRWGRPAAPPAPPEGEVGELVEWLHAKGREGLECGLEFAQENGRQLTRAAALLEQLSAAAPAVVPIPVSERLPGEGDCDAEGRCWWLKERSNPEHDLLLPTWHLQRQGPAGTRFFRFTHWLPAQALPLPAPQGGEVE